MLRLIALYARAEARILRLIVRALVSGRLGRSRERTRRRREARQVLRDLDAQALPRANRLVEESFREGANRGGRQRIRDDSQFGRIASEALDLLEDNLNGRLTDATRTVGRRVDDVFRREGLRHATEQLRNERPQETVTRDMGERLAGDGTTSFVDKAGRRWGLERYAEMAIKSAIAEANNMGTEAAMRARNFDLVTISSHNCPHHPKDSRHPCVALEGKTFSLTGRAEEFPKLPSLPPWHPQCQHFIFPAVEAADERATA